MKAALLRSLTAALTALALGACADAGPVAPLASPGAPLLSTGEGAKILECPVSVEQSVTGSIDLLGGTLELDGHRLVIPAGAVLLPTEFTLTVPVSNYMKIRVTANGMEHFQFEQPVSMTVSYSRCTRSNIEKNGLEIFYVGADDVVLQAMGGTDDKEAREVTTQTDHLSDYAVGAP